MKSKSKLCNEYGLTIERLEMIIWECFRWHLSEDELNEFIMEYHFRLEHRLNMREQCIN